MFNITLIAQTPDWQWAIQASGVSFDYGLSITSDEAGNSYVTGCFSVTTTFGSYSLTSNGGKDIFIAKIDTEGNWQWATQAGGNTSDYGISITIDNSGHIYVTGFFEGTATFGSNSLTSSGGQDIFVAKMDANGNWLWVIQAGGSSEDGGNGITIDADGNGYLTGFFQGTATFGSYSLTSSGYGDIFVAKMDANGNWLWASKAGGSDQDEGNAITIDEAGNSYVTGSFRETATFDYYSITSSGNSDIFVAKMNTGGNWLWATTAGGSGDGDRGYGIIINYDMNCYVTGAFDGTATFGSYSLTSNGVQDIFVAKIDTGGNWLRVTQAGGSDSDIGNAITIDNVGNCYITGNFKDTSIFGSYTIISSGYFDVFVAKMDTGGNWQWATKAGGSDWDYGGDAITLDNAGNCYVIGSFEGTSVFGSYSLTSSGAEDIFVAKLNSSVFAENEIISIINSLSNYPNPFNPTTTISFQVSGLRSNGAASSSQAGDSYQDVELSIYNIKGQKIKTLPFSPSQFPSVSVTWDGTDDNDQSVSSGIYFYKLKAGKDEQIRKMILMK